ncbi:MAG: ATP-binding protein, partial [Solirubrobacterales bacterium]
MDTNHIPGTGLVGRAPELARLRGLVDGLAGTGRGGAVVIAGMPGIGKTALLKAIAPQSVRVLDVAGAASEATLPWGGLADLLEPLMGHERALDPPARAALRGALALERTTVAESARVLHAAAQLLAAASEERRLALRVDDLQWLDPSSRQAIEFLARRAERIGIALIAAWSLRGEPFDPWPGVPVLALDQLERAEALTLARRARLTPAVAAALVDAVGGNPLALIEAPAQLTPAARDGREPLPDALPVGSRLEAVFAERVGGLPDDCREALLLLALGDGDPRALAAALGDLDPLEPAEEAGLIEIAPTGIAFVHPIVRTAIARAVSPGARRAAHRALA